MLYFAGGSLPWQSLKAATEGERNERIKEKKMDTPVEELCRDLPEEFATYVKYVRDLAFNKRPNYSYLRKLLRNLFVSEGFEYDYVFDWTIKKFFMIHNSTDHRSVLQTQSSTKVNKRRRASTNIASITPPVTSLGQPIGQRVSKRTGTRRLRNTEARKKRRV
jgi:hypothetical protein